MWFPLEELRQMCLLLSSTNSLTVRVPNGAQTGPITVAVGGAIGTSSANFTVVLPVVLSFRPEKGIVGTTVKIMGENFSNTPEDNVVSFGGIETDVPSSVSTNSLTVRVPNGAQTGPITVAVGGPTGTSSTDFTVLSPVVLSFRPEKGIVGTTVTIMGENFSSTPEDNVVSFGGIETDVPSSVQY